MTLTFVEPTAKPGERVFDVAVDGAMTAVRQIFPMTAGKDGVQLKFRPSKGEAVMSAIEVAPRGR